MKKPLICHPVTLLFLGVIPALASSATLLDALGMGLAALSVLLCSTLVLSLLRAQLSPAARFAATLITVAAFATMAQLLLRAFLPRAVDMLGYYAAILAAELLIFGREEKTGAALGSALMSGLCFFAFLLVLGALRELFGSASIAGAPVALLKSCTIPLLSKTSGGFILFAILLAVVNKLFPGQEKAADLAPADALPEAEKEA